MKTLIYGSFLVIALMCQSCQVDPPSFTINTSATDIVAGQSVTFSETSATGTTTEWTFEGANIPSSNAKSVAVTYNTPGIYTVTAVVSNKSKSTTQRTVITVHKANWSFVFPGGGQRNNNATIGDFCCTGETMTLLNQNNKPLGYAYFFSWDGQAYNLPPSSIAPNFRIFLSGTTDLKATKSHQQPRPASHSRAHSIGLPAQGSLARRAFLPCGQTCHRAAFLHRRTAARSPEPVAAARAEARAGPVHRLRLPRRPART